MSGPGGGQERKEFRRAKRSGERKDYEMRRFVMDQIERAVISIHILQDAS